MMFSVDIYERKDELNITAQPGLAVQFLCARLYTCISYTCIRDFREQLPIPQMPRFSAIYVNHEG